MELKLKTTRPGARVPAYATPGSAAMDLCAACEERVAVAPGERVLIPTGIAIELPGPGYVALVFARSSLGVRHGMALSNGVGVIDSDYRGEIQVGMINLSGEEYVVQPGERIAQMAILPVAHAQITVVDELSDTGRGAGGFGSTGKF